MSLKLALNLGELLLYEYIRLSAISLPLVFTGMLAMATRRVYLAYNAGKQHEEFYSESPRGVDQEHVPQGSDTSPDDSQNNI